MVQEDIQFIVLYRVAATHKPLSGYLLNREINKLPNALHYHLEKNQWRGSILYMQKSEKQLGFES